MKTSQSAEPCSRAMRLPITAVVLALMLSARAQITNGQNPAQAWVQRYNTPAETTDTAKKVAVDAFGNVIVAGTAPFP